MYVHVGLLGVYWYICYLDILSFDLSKFSKLLVWSLCVCECVRRSVCDGVSKLIAFLRLCFLVFVEHNDCRMSGRHIGVVYCFLGAAEPPLFAGMVTSTPTFPGVILTYIGSSASYNNRQVVNNTVIW